jgi:signal peptidase I
MVVIQKTKNVENGDIIVFKSDMTFGEAGVNELPFYRRIFVNENTKKKLIKRVIAGPGDKIEIDGPDVYVNDQLLDEPYINSDGNNVIFYDEIPEGYYFVMGDNRQWSMDSRNPEIGLISKDRIVGKTTFRIFPFSRFGTIDEL